MTDYWDVAAEFGGWFGPSEPVVPSALAQIVVDGVVVDLGAGTGASTLALADALPQAQVVAVESSRGQRIALMARLLARPDLHQRVTVLPQDLFTADLPESWSAVYANHLLCQLEPEPRQRLLELIAKRLAPHGLAVIDWHYTDEPPVPAPERLVKSFTLGGLEYQRWWGHRPQGTDHLAVRTTYKVLRDGQVLSADVRESTLPVVLASVLRRQIASAGLVADEPDQGLVLLRRA